MIPDSDEHGLQVVTDSVQQTQEVLRYRGLTENTGERYVKRLQDVRSTVLGRLDEILANLLNSVFSMNCWLNLSGVMSNCSHVVMKTWYFLGIGKSERTRREFDGRFGTVLWITTRYCRSEEVCRCGRAFLE